MPLEHDFQGVRAPKSHLLADISVTAMLSLLVDERVLDDVL